MYDDGKQAKVTDLFSAALRATESVGKKSESQLLVRTVGVEPTSLAALGPKPSVFASFTTSALFVILTIILLKSIDSTSKKTKTAPKKSTVFTL